MLCQHTYSIIVKSIKDQLFQINKQSSIKYSTSQQITLMNCNSLVVLRLNGEIHFLKN